MRNIIIYMIFAMLTLHCSVTEAQIIYTNEDSCRIETILKEINRADTNIVISTAEKFIGTPYKGGTLDKENTEILTINTKELDCTTFVELVSALVITAKEGKKQFQSFCYNLKGIRYRNGICNGYTSRLHYISQWIKDKWKKGKIIEITTTAHIATQKLNLNYMSKHPYNYNQLKENPLLVEDIKKGEADFQNIDIKYIPKYLLNDSKKIQEIRTGDIIAIVTDIEGLDVSHLGFAIWKENKLHLLHASSNANMVLEETQTLYSYMRNKKRNLGIRVFRIE